MGKKSAKKQKVLLKQNIKQKQKQPVLEEQISLPNQKQFKKQNTTSIKKNKNKDVEMRRKLQKNKNKMKNKEKRLLQSNSKTKKTVFNLQVQQSQLEEEDLSLISMGSTPIQRQNQESQESVQVMVQENFSKKQGFDLLVDETQKQFIQRQQFHECFFRLAKGKNKQQNKTNFLYVLEREKYYRLTMQTSLEQPDSMTNKIQISLITKSSQFLQNGKTCSQKKLEFYRSCIIRLKTKNQMRESIEKKSKKDLKQNLMQQINPSEQDKQKVMDLLNQFDAKSEEIILSNHKLNIVETSEPFIHFNTKILQTNHTAMLIGLKNTGKSTLSQYLINLNLQNICILDCDIGRSLVISGCVSLLTKQQVKNIWIGQFTPFNCIQTYLKAIRQLYKLYRQKYFAKKLIINTMGYLTGVGEMILYEIYNIINPSEVIVLKSEKKTEDQNLKNILYNLKTGNFVQKLLSERGQDKFKQFNQKKSQLQTINLENPHAQGKGVPIRFQNILYHQRHLKTILQLIKLIKDNKLQKINVKQYYSQDKSGNITLIDENKANEINMRIVILGKFFSPKNHENSLYTQDSKLFEAFGVGYGFDGSIYISQKQIQQNLTRKINLQVQQPNMIGVLTENIDFQKNFYMLHELSLLQFQLEYGQIPYILPVIKGLGSKGVRNNPSKKRD